MVYQFHRFPETGIVSDSVGYHFAQRLPAHFTVTHGVREAECRVILRVESRQRLCGDMSIELVTVGS